MKKNLYYWIAGLIVLIILAFIVRPFFHPFLMPFIVSPLKAILIIGILGAIISLVMTFRVLKAKQISPNNYTFYAPNGYPWKTFGVSIIAIIVILFGLGLESSIRYLITSKQITYESRTDLPKFEPVRLTPKQVAARYASDSFQDPQEYLGDSQIIIDKDGNLKRVFPRLPDGGILYLIKKLSGFVVVDVDTLDRKVSIENQEFKYSEGVGIFDNLYYRLLQEKYFVNYTSEPVYTKDENGDWVAIVSYMKYRGFPFTVPYWAGTMIVRSDGTIGDYSPDQAQALPFAKNLRLYPKELVDFYTESYSYKWGLINKWFLHKNEIEVVNLPSDEKIIHVSTSEGFKQMVVAEPYGRSYGIYKIFFFDATTGKREIIEYDQNSQLTGPVAAADYIKKAYPTYSWDTFVLSEPRPIKIKENLYWTLSIIPSDFAGIAKTVFFNAKTNDVVGFDTEEEIDKFIKEGVAELPSPTQTTTETSSNQEVLDKINSIEQQLQELKGLVE